MKSEDGIISSFVDRIRSIRKKEEDDPRYFKDREGLRKDIVNKIEENNLVLIGAPSIGKSRELIKLISDLDELDRESTLLHSLQEKDEIEREGKKEGVSEDKFCSIEDIEEIDDDDIVIIDDFFRVFEETEEKNRDLLKAILKKEKALVISTTPYRWNYLINRNEKLLADLIEREPSFRFLGYGKKEEAKNEFKKSKEDGCPVDDLIDKVKFPRYKSKIDLVGEQFDYYTLIPYAYLLYDRQLADGLIHQMEKFPKMLSLGYSKIEDMLGVSLDSLGEIVSNILPTAFLAGGIPTFLIGYIGYKAIKGKGGIYKDIENSFGKLIKLTPSQMELIEEKLNLRPLSLEKLKKLWEEGPKRFDELESRLRENRQRIEEITSVDPEFLQEMDRLNEDIERINSKLEYVEDIYEAYKDIISRVIKDPDILKSDYENYIEYLGLIEEGRDWNIIQQSIYEKIVGEIIDDKEKIILLKGQMGSGKTTCAYSVANTLEDKGYFVGVDPKLDSDYLRFVLNKNDSDKKVIIYDLVGRDVKTKENEQIIDLFDILNEGVCDSLMILCRNYQADILSSKIRRISSNPRWRSFKDLWDMKEEILLEGINKENMELLLKDNFDRYDEKYLDRICDLAQVGSNINPLVAIAAATARFKNEKNLNEFEGGKEVIWDSISHIFEAPAGMYENVEKTLLLRYLSCVFLERKQIEKIKEINQDFRYHDFSRFMDSIDLLFEEGAYWTIKPDMVRDLILQKHSLDHMDDTLYVFKQVDEDVEKGNLSAQVGTRLCYLYNKDIRKDECLDYLEEEILDDVYSDNKELYGALLEWICDFDIPLDPSKIYVDGLYERYRLFITDLEEIDYSPEYMAFVKDWLESDTIPFEEDREDAILVNYITVIFTRIFFANLKERSREIDERFDRFIDLAKEADDRFSKNVRLKTVEQRFWEAIIVLSTLENKENLGYIIDKLSESPLSIDKGDSKLNIIDIITRLFFQQISNNEDPELPEIIIDKSKGLLVEEDKKEFFELFYSKIYRSLLQIEDIDKTQIKNVVSYFDGCYYDVKEKLKDFELIEVYSKAFFYILDDKSSSEKVRKEGLKEINKKAREELNQDQFKFLIKDFIINYFLQKDLSEEVKKKKFDIIYHMCLQGIREEEIHSILELCLSSIFIEENIGFEEKKKWLKYLNREYIYQLIKGTSLQGSILGVNQNFQKLRYYGHSLGNILSSSKLSREEKDRIIELFSKEYIGLEFNKHLESVVFYSNCVTHMIYPEINYKKIYEEREELIPIVQDIASKNVGKVALPRYFSGMIKELIKFDERRLLSDIQRFCSEDEEDKKFRKTRSEWIDYIHQDFLDRTDFSEDMGKLINFYYDIYFFTLCVDEDVKKDLSEKEELLDKFDKIIGETDEIVDRMYFTNTIDIQIINSLNEFIKRFDIKTDLDLYLKRKDELFKNCFEISSKELLINCVREEIELKNLFDVNTTSKDMNKDKIIDHLEKMDLNDCTSRLIYDLSKNYVDHIKSDRLDLDDMNYLFKNIDNIKTDYPKQYNDLIENIYQYICINWDYSSPVTNDVLRRIEKRYHEVLE